jgi:hypothetical protein
LLTKREADIMDRAIPGSRMADSTAIAHRLKVLLSTEAQRLKRVCDIVRLATGWGADTAQRQRDVVPRELAPWLAPTETDAQPKAFDPVEWEGQKFGTGEGELHRMSLARSDDVLALAIAQHFPAADGYISTPQPSLWHGVFPAEVCLFHPAKALAPEDALTGEFNTLLVELKKMATADLEAAKEAMLPRQLISLRVPLRTGPRVAGGGPKKPKRTAAKVPGRFAGEHLAGIVHAALRQDNPLDKNDTRPMEYAPEFWARFGGFGDHRPSPGAPHRKNRNRRQGPRDPSPPPPNNQ